MNKKELLSRSINGLIFKLAPPGILAMLITSVNALADSIFAGQWVSSSAMSGIIVSIPLLSINSAIVRLVGIGSSSVVSRAIGSNNNYVTDIILYYVIVLVLIFSVLISLLGYFFAESLITLMGVSGETFNYAVTYFKIMSIGNLPFILGLTTSLLIRSEGKIAYAMKITGFSVILNLLLTPLFCGYFDLGVKGISLSTIISMTIYSFLVLRYFVCKQGKLIFGKLPSSIDLKLLFEILSIGISGFVQQITGIFRQLFLFKTIAYITNPLGLVVFSAFYRIFSFIAMPCFGIVQALQPVVGVNFGAKKFHRVFKSYYTFVLYSILLTVIICIPVFIFPEIFLNILIPEIKLTDKDIFHFRIFLLVLLFFPISPNSITFFQSIGKGKQAFYLTTFRDAILFYPLVFFCWSIKEESILYYGLLLENIIYALILILIVVYIQKKTLPLYTK